MSEVRLPRKILEWYPPERRRRKERPLNSWMQEVTTGEGNWTHGMDRERRMEKKNKTLGTERYANIDTL